MTSEAYKWVRRNVMENAPDFTLEELMERLATVGFRGQKHAVVVRTDPWRDSRPFTLICDRTGRIADTDDPKEALCEWLQRMYGFIAKER